MNYFIYICLVFLPMLAGGMLMLTNKKEDEKFRNNYVLFFLVLNCLLVVASYKMTPVSLLTVSKDLAVNFKTDYFAGIFATLVAVMWLAVGAYSFEYMKHVHNKPRFYLFYLATLGALNGVCFASNYLSLYLFFELMTLLSMPMVLHEQNAQSISAAKKYLLYSVFGASLGLLGFFFMHTYGTTTEFVAGGTLDLTKVAGKENLLLTVALLTICGFGAKGGMFPLHDWLPTAHPVAPACASSVLSGVITKAGVLAIIRVVFFQFGASFISGTWVQTTWICLALFTVFMGSMLAYKEKIMKKRLAYSTVSQVSYILFGLACLNPVSLMGALLHVVAHSLIKNVLFMSAGAIIYRSGYTKVNQLNGIGKVMPVTMALYTIASLGLIGIPPTMGFVSKWYLAEGSLNSVQGMLGWFGPVVLLVSALLTAGYLFSITINAYFKEATMPMNFKETTCWMLVPMGVLVAGIVLFGMFPTVLMNIYTAAIGGLF